MKSFLPSSTPSRPRSKKKETKRSRPKTRRTTKKRRSGKLTPGLIKGMKALLRSTHPRVSAAMKAGIRKKLKAEGIR